MACSSALPPLKPAPVRVACCARACA